VEAVFWERKRRGGKCVGDEEIVEIEIKRWRR
jgi:hypothetical protein